MQPTLGIGACLVGQPVRYNGESKRKQSHIEILKKHMQLKSFCPEMAIGLGVPRQTIRIVDGDNDIILTDSDEQTENYTPAIRAFAQKVLKQEPNLCGYILVKGSPSCGYDRVKRYNQKGNIAGHDAMGVFAAELQRLNPLLPLDEDGRLNDAPIRESFMCRVYTYQKWIQLNQSPLSHKALTNFWAQHKYLLMAHDIVAYKRCGQIVAQASKTSLEDSAEEFILTLMQGLKKQATRKKYTNVLHHIQGYLKKQLDADNKQELTQVISNYRQGIVPLVVPMTLLKHHFRNNPSSYINMQAFMQPFPETLSLRNRI